METQLGNNASTGTGGRRTEAPWLCILVIWFGLALYFGPPAGVVAAAMPDRLAACAVVLFYLCWWVLAFYAIYHLVMAGSAGWIGWREKSGRERSEGERCGGVAVKDAETRRHGDGENRAWETRAVVGEPRGAGSGGEGESGAADWISDSSVAATGGTSDRSVAATWPAVAVLYPTRNDFCETAVERLCSLNYPNSTVFICDDSTLEEFRTRADVWAEGKPQVRVMRRDGRRGFKAGNLNRVLNLIESDFEFFVVCDADGLLPVDFIQACLVHFERSEDFHSLSNVRPVRRASGLSAGPAFQSVGNGQTERPPDGTGQRPVLPTYLAFVQARQEALPAMRGTWADALGAVVGTHFRWQVRARSRAGFVMFYGHGALVSLEAWRQSGGFPEIATEDLAFSLELRSKGWCGIYADDIICQEAFPPTLGQLSRRNEKWIRGTAECLRKHGRRFFLAPGISWTEKADVAANAAFHFLPCIMLLFLILLAWPLPWLIQDFRAPASHFGPALPIGVPPFDWMFGVPQERFWSWDWLILTLLLFAAGSLPAWHALRGHPRSIAKAVFTWAATISVWLGSLVHDSLAAAAYLFTRKAPFAATGDAALSGPNRRRWTGLVTAWAGMPLAEGAVGLGFGFAAWWGRNPWLLAPCFSLLATAISRRGSSPPEAPLGRPHDSWRDPDRISWLLVLPAPFVLLLTLTTVLYRMLK
ncbi:MAG: glycosyltransferase [Verrucomicrobiales bacterium]